jgi:outer membrane protein, multidrug efflux system
MTTNITTYIAIAMLLFLSACKVSKDITVPTDMAPKAFRDVTNTDTANIATIEWKSFFQDENLRQLIENTIASNYDMQTAVKNIEAAQLIARQSRMGYLPAASLVATGGITRPSDNSLNGLSLSKFLEKSYVEDYSLSAVVSWEADIWGKIRNQQSKALASYLQTKEAKKAIQTNLVSSVAKGYYNLLMLDAQIAIAKKNLMLNDSTLNIMRLQYNAGQVTNLAVQQAEAQRLVAAQLIPQLEQEIAVQENALSVLAAITPGAIKRNDGINDLQFTSELSSGIPSQLLQNRPDVRTSELELTIANANAGISKAQMYPSLSITVSGGLNSFKASNWFNMPASLFAAAAGGITQPLFQRKQLRTQYELAKVEREKSVIRFRQSVLTAVGEVSDALVREHKLKEQQAIAATRVNTLHQATGNADLLFKNGMANYLEVITAQSNVLQAELELAVLKKDQLNATVELYRSLGGGWK